MMTGGPGRELVLPPVDDVFRVVARTIVPEAETLSPEAWDALEAIVEHALEDRPPAMRRQLQLFLRVLDLLPLFRHGRRLRGLDPARRARFLARIQDSRIYKLRQGFWGLRTLVYMGYYARPQAGAAIGYDARLRGWLEHPEAPAQARERAGS
ncbi:MAG TPA: gluconate 2-dehydrogenase subunit 3 family protein [Longimicrobiales bacterium]|nr:gluconate 2-dehydrogenase subunit 3 family protein [Longimicrobiales bacterium]